MRLSIAQIRPVKGNIEANIQSHLRFIRAAVQQQVDVIVFPELSLTGYEPSLAKELAITAADERLQVLQEISDQHNITICVGAPTQNDSNVHLSMIIIQPQREKTVYSKRFLYKHENDVFTPGKNPLAFQSGDGEVIAPAICYELSQTQHHEDAVKQGASLYVASVLNSVQGVESDLAKMSAVAEKYGMTAFLSNYVGHSGGYECAGRSSVWDKSGTLVAQLDGQSEGQIIYNTVTEKPFLLQH